jgi:hypothetical protein
MSAITEERQEVVIGKSKFSFDPQVRIHVVHAGTDALMVYMLRDGRLFCFSERGPVDVPEDLKPKIINHYFGKQDSAEGSRTYTPSSN